MDANTQIKVGSLPEVFMTPNANVAETFHFTKALQHVRLTLTGLSVFVDQANDYGGTKLASFEDNNILLVGAEVNLVMTKGGAANGIISTTDVDVAGGSAVATNATLSNTMINILPVQHSTADVLVDTIAAHSLVATPVLAGIVEGSPAVFLNVSPVGGITASDTVTFSGTVDIFYFNLENVVS